MYTEKKKVKRHLHSNTLREAGKWHEIVKYKPENYNEDGVYTVDEWTHISDVGRVFNGHIFTIEEYLVTEDRYASVVISLMKAHNCQYIIIGNLLYCETKREKMNREKEMLSDPYSYHNIPLLPTLRTIRLGERIHISNRKRIEDAVRLNLRGYIYVYLMNRKQNLIIDFGYDLYMLLKSRLSKDSLRKIVVKEGLYLDPRND